MAGVYLGEIEPAGPKTLSYQRFWPFGHLETPISCGTQGVTITVDEDLVDEAGRAVAEGRASSVSAWIGEAMVARQANDRRVEALGELIAEYEAVHGTITEEELAQQAQADRDSAALVRAELRRAG